MKKNYFTYITLVVAFSVNGVFTFGQKISSTTNTVKTFGQFELTISTKPGKKINPFTDVTLQADFKDENGNITTVHGFCDADDGSIFRARFMPVHAGTYSYHTVLSVKGKKKVFDGNLTVIPSDNNGPVRVDSAHPWHMLYEGSGKHFFWNSTTCYFLLGWKDENVIQRVLDRFEKYGINRIRVGINARTVGAGRWYEPNVVECKDFTYLFNVWPSQRPLDVNNPGYDVTRFNVSHWQKMDRLIEYANKKNIQVSLIFYVDGLDYGCDPFKKEHAGGEDEKRYYAYTAARYSAFPNIMWDVTNEYHLFRTVDWVNEMAPYLKSLDENKHILSVHGSSDFPFRKAPWIDVALFQSWDECGGYQFMAGNRTLQTATGKIMPQINEEYGYENHYPPWGCGAVTNKQPDFRSGLYRSQLAWEMCMAGGYQTTGERADFGTGAGANTGGGWINGRGNDSMIMLRYYQIMRNTFEQTAYWNMAPHNELVSYGDLCLSNPGKEYLAYFRTHHARIEMNNGEKYAVKMIDPQTGDEKVLGDVVISNGAWDYPYPLTKHTAILLKRIN